MPKVERFSFACDTQERHAIRRLAKQLRRSQSDAMRWLIRTAGDLELVAEFPIDDAPAASQTLEVIHA